jgi:ketosteroid isomerase-like protein
MSQENVEVMRSIYESFLSEDTSRYTDPSKFAALGFGDEIQLHPDPEAYWVGVNEIYRGPEGFAAYVESVTEAFEDYRAEIEDFLEIGDKVVILAIERGRGRGSGADVEMRTAHVWTMRGGKPVRLDLYIDRERAFKDIGPE